MQFTFHVFPEDISKYLQSTKFVRLKISYQLTASLWALGVQADLELFLCPGFFKHHPILAEGISHSY